MTRREALVDDLLIAIQKMADLDESGEIREDFPEVFKIAREIKAAECPNCRKKATLEHFRTSPECSAYMASLCALYRGSKRVTVTRAGGRPKKQPEKP